MASSLQVSLDIWNIIRRWQSNAASCIVGPVIEDHTLATYPCGTMDTMVRNQLIIMYHHGIVYCTSSCSGHNFERLEFCPLGTRGISADTFSVNRDIKAAMYPQLTSVQFHHHSVTRRVLILYNPAQILNTALYGASLKHNTEILHYTTLQPISSTLFLFRHWQ